MLFSKWTSLLVQRCRGRHRQSRSRTAMKINRLWTRFHKGAEGIEHLYNIKRLLNHSITELIAVHNTVTQKIRIGHSFTPLKLLIAVQNAELLKMLSYNSYICIKNYSKTQNFIQKLLKIAKLICLCFLSTKLMAKVCRKFIVLETISYTLMQDMRNCRIYFVCMKNIHKKHNTSSILHNRFFLSSLSEAIAPSKSLSFLATPFEEQSISEIISLPSLEFEK